jgi:hypothetical protein
MEKRGRAPMTTAGHQTSCGSLCPAGRPWTCARDGAGSPSCAWSPGPRLPIWTGQPAAVNVSGLPTRPHPPPDRLTTR